MDSPLLFLMLACVLSLVAGHALSQRCPTLAAQAGSDPASLADLSGLFSVYIDTEDNPG